MIKLKALKENLRLLEAACMNKEIQQYLNEKFELIRTACI